MNIMVSLPYISYAQAVKLDELIINKYGLSVGQLSELAGRAVAVLVANLLKDSSNPTVLILAGKGGNGCDGLSSARHLHSLGFSVKFFLADELLTENIKLQVDLCRKFGILEVSHQELESSILNSSLVVDALLGYSIDGNPRNLYREAIMRLASFKGLIVSVDVPSGYELKTGVYRTPYVSPTAILCFSLPKIGLEDNENVFVASVGAPPEVFSAIDVSVPLELFRNGIIKVDGSSSFIEFEYPGKVGESGEPIDRKELFEQSGTDDDSYESVEQESGGVE